MKSRIFEIVEIAIENLEIFLKTTKCLIEINES